MREHGYSDWISSESQNDDLFIVLSLAARSNFGLCSPPCSLLIRNRQKSLQSSSFDILSGTGALMPPSPSRISLLAVRTTVAEEASHTSPQVREAFQYRMSRATTENTKPFYSKLTRPAELPADIKPRTPALEETSGLTEHHKTFFEPIARDILVCESCKMKQEHLHV
jgi:hypothetical protein